MYVNYILHFARNRERAPENAPCDSSFFTKCIEVSPRKGQHGMKHANYIPATWETQATASPRPGETRRGEYASPAAAGSSHRKQRPVDTNRVFFGIATSKSEHNRPHPHLRRALASAPAPSARVRHRARIRARRPGRSRRRARIRARAGRRKARRCGEPRASWSVRRGCREAQERARVGAANQTATLDRVQFFP